MPFAEAMDDTSWGLPNASTTPVFPGAEVFCTTSLLDHLKAAAARDPAAIALVSLTASLNYADLLRLARNTAYAISQRTRPGEAVAWMLPRTPDAIAALLGCMIAGRPCMIVDTANPADRQAALIADAAPALLLLSEAPPFPCTAPVLTISDALAGPGDNWAPDHAWDPDAPFVIHFTSGSTGRPKGITLSARSALYRGLFGAETLGITAASRMLQSNCPIASGGLSTLLGTLARGARALLVDLAADGASNVLKLLDREAVTVATVVPPTLNMLLQLSPAKQAFRALRSLRLGGAGVLWADLGAWRRMLPADCDIYHAYASTEGLNMAQWIVPTASAADEIRVPAGPLHLCHDYALLDEDGQRAAPGEPGELILRGPYVALGEWRGGRLVPGRMNPVPGRPGWRSFRTGDVLRVHPDGMIRVLGRVDRQVKINGVLVQPAEIEAVLKSAPGITDAAVVARTTPAGSTLHGFVATEGADPEQLIAALRRRLAKTLPAVFRPASLRVLARLPTMPSGKIDLVALARSAE